MTCVKILTLFPDMFPGPLSCSVVGRALKNNVWTLEVINIRDFALDAHKSVDDSPAGGGNGMVMRVDVLARAIDYAVDAKNAKIFCLSPRGKIVNQAKLHELVRMETIILICGRFEGIDQRLLDHYGIEEISIGNYVLTGGELPAYILIDGFIRLIPGVLGNKNSSSEESFAINSDYEKLVEYPQYTRPNIWRGNKIPDVLTQGNHKKIKEWRLKAAQSLTQKTRPDLE